MNVNKNIKTVVQPMVEFTNLETLEGFSLVPPLCIALFHISLIFLLISDKNRQTSVNVSLKSNYLYIAADISSLLSLQ